MTGKPVKPNWPSLVFWSNADKKQINPLVRMSVARCNVRPSQNCHYWWAVRMNRHVAEFEQITRRMQKTLFENICWSWLCHKTLKRPVCVFIWLIFLLFCNSLVIITKEEIFQFPWIIFSSCNSTFWSYAVVVRAFCSIITFALWSNNAQVLQRRSEPHEVISVGVPWFDTWIPLTPCLARGKLKLKYAES